MWARRPLARLASGAPRRHLTSKTLEVVEATLPAVAAAGTDFTNHFYQRMFTKHPGLFNIFNKTNQRQGKQQKALFNAVAASAISVLESGKLPVDIIEGINHKHCALNIVPAQYAVVGENMLGTITDLLNPGQEVLDAWGELYGALADHCVKREEEIYKATEGLPGGWRGLRKFKITEKEGLGKYVMRFSFEPEDGGPICTYSPGQYTTVWLHPEAWENRQPRHYSLISESGSGVYTIAVKKEEQGLMSRFLHDRMAVGDVVDLSPPYGNFNMQGVEKLWTQEGEAPLILMSAGVGITPMLSMLSSLKLSTGSHEDRPVTWLHAAKNGREHAFRDYLTGLARAHPQELTRRVWYESPTADDVKGDSNLSNYHFKGLMQLGEVKEHLHLDNSGTSYYFCGPPDWMLSVSKQLTDLGVPMDRQHCESFGPAGDGLPGH